MYFELLVTTFYVPETAVGLERNLGLDSEGSTYRVPFTEVERLGVKKESFVPSVKGVPTPRLIRSRRPPSRTSTYSREGKGLNLGREIPPDLTPGPPAGPSLKSPP